MTTDAAPSRLKIAFGLAIYALFFGAMGLALVMAAQEYPNPPAVMTAR